jgi:hypothetical protein
MLHVNSPASILLRRTRECRRISVLAFLALGQAAQRPDQHLRNNQIARRPTLRMVRSSMPSSRAPSWNMAPLSAGCLGSVSGRIGAHAGGARREARHAFGESAEGSESRQGAVVA